MVDRYQEGLNRLARPFGVFVDVDDGLYLVNVVPGVVAELVGASSPESLTTSGGIVFWFDAASRHPVNRMATLNVFATADLSARDVPLLCGPVLITGFDSGRPTGLSDAQWNALKATPDVSWPRVDRTLRRRVMRTERRLRRNGFA